MGDDNLLQLCHISSFIQSSFWNKFAELKINTYKLSDNEINVWGYISICSSWNTPILEVDSTSFNTQFSVQKAIPYHGKIFNKNTLEEFKNVDKLELIKNEGNKLFDSIENGEVLDKPSILNNFILLSFSDLKKFHFYYWFAFPVPSKVKFQLEICETLSLTFSESQISSLLEEYLKLDVHDQSYFLIHKNKIYTLKSILKEISLDNYSDCYFGFTETTNNVRIQLRNYALLLLYYCPFLIDDNIKFVSFVLEKNTLSSKSHLYSVKLSDITTVKDEITWIGWEKNENNKFGPRFSNMRNTMDPKILFEESVDLNLKLMKWRLVPNIDLEKIKNCRCLLLGSGTLGCSVARTLLGWGVRNITFVDNSTVSFSNPVRQSLYTYDDAVSNKSKAKAAADSLKTIFPSINAQGVQMTIPMPGHCTLSDNLDTIKKSVDDLIKLFEDHDIIFLLTDSRESRWLPTLLGAVMNKMVINCALGFDTYLIIRHGGLANNDNMELSNPEGFEAIRGNNLGCYFCNDVTAPGNSMTDRTLDQQCTVTRPGISLIAGALAVELAVSLLQHADGINAPSYYKISQKADINEVEFQTVLGILPHSIRGFLSNFNHVLPATPRFDKCIACSNVIVEEYKNNGFNFLLQAFTDSKHLENVTGLSVLHDEKNFIDVLEMSDNEDWCS